MLRGASSASKRKPSAESPQDQPPKRKSLQQSTLFPARHGLSPHVPKLNRHEESAGIEAERGIVWSFCDPRGGAKGNPAGGARALPESSQAGPRKKAQQVDALLSLMKRGKQRQKQCAEGTSAAAPPVQPSRPALMGCWQPRSTKVTGLRPCTQTLADPHALLAAVDSLACRHTGWVAREQRRRHTRRGSEQREQRNR